MTGRSRTLSTRLMSPTQLSTNTIGACRYRGTFQDALFPEWHLTDAGSGITIRPFGEAIPSGSRRVDVQQQHATHYAEPSHSRRLHRVAALSPQVVATCAEARILCVKRVRAPTYTMRRT